MPIVTNSDDSTNIHHPLLDSIIHSENKGIIHHEYGTIFCCKNEWLFQFFHELESIVDSTLARRLAHASLSNSLKFSYSKWDAKKGFFGISKTKHYVNAFEKWASERVYLGRGLVTSIQWPYSFHIERPLMVSIEVGEICAYLQSLINESLRYHWRDDGGSNASVTFEPIDVPYTRVQQRSLDFTHEIPISLNIDEGVGWPSRDGIPITTIPTEVFHEFYYTLNELSIKNVDDPLIDINDFANMLDNVVCIASIRACNIDEQRYLLDNYEQFKLWFNHRIESNGLGKLVSANNFDTENRIIFQFNIPWPIIAGIILHAWQRNNGILGSIHVESIEENIVEIIIKSRREIVQNLD